MTSSAPTNSLKAFALVALAVAIVAAGAYGADVDDPSLPGAGPASVGILLMAIGVVVGVRAAARDGRSIWVRRTVLAVGVLIAIVAGLAIHAHAVTAPLFATPQDVPSVVDSSPSPHYTAAVARARDLVRAGMLAQNLPGVSVAVGVVATEGLPAGASANGGLIVWAEGFGWRDVDTRAPVTPKTRFNVGTAASAVPAATIARLGLTNTGAEPAGEWSPEHVGEPEENPPPFTAIRHGIFRPLGLAPSQPLAGDRATFYVPRSNNDPLRGRRLMYMRDLACCAGTMASYSTASDLVRVGLAGSVDIDGDLAGGMVASLLARSDSGIVVVVLSNIAHSNTAALALKIKGAFEQQAR
jgi:hypothetical protein